MIVWTISMSSVPGRLKVTLLLAKVQHLPLLRRSAFWQLQKLTILPNLKIFTARRPKDKHSVRFFSSRFEKRRSRSSSARSKIKKKTSRLWASIHSFTDLAKVHEPVEVIQFVITMGILLPNTEISLNHTGNGRLMLMTVKTASMIPRDREPAIHRLRLRPHTCAQQITLRTSPKRSSIEENGQRPNIVRFSKIKCFRRRKRRTMQRKLFYSRILNLSRKFGSSCTTCERNSSERR